MLVSYMRVSSVDDRQSVDLQRDAQIAAGCDHRHLYTDKASDARDDWPGLKACLDYLGEGDILVVWKLDRLGRLLPHRLTIVTDLKERGIAFRSLTEQMDTTTPHGELLFSLFGALAQHERAMTRERVMAGLAAAKRAGTTGRAPAHDRHRDAGADHRCARWRGQQGVRLPDVQGAMLDADRYAGLRRLDAVSVKNCNFALFVDRASCYVITNQASCTERCTVRLLISGENDD